MDDPRDVIVRPVVSEKSYALSEKGVYIFVVPPRGQQGGDPPVGRAGLQRQGQPTSIRSTGRASASATARQSTFGKRPDTKRAIVTLAAGQSIPLFETS